MSENIFTNNAIEQALDRMPPATVFFTAEQVAASVGPLPDDPDEREEVLHHISRLAGSSDRFFRLSEERFAIRNNLFAHKEFLITPSDFEIESGVLFPGHRFAPFCSPEVYTSEVELSHDECKTAFAKQDFRCDFHEVLGIHSLLGSGQVYDLVTAEHPDNATFLGGDPRAKVTLTVFDLADFYRKTGFSGGDALVTTVMDYDGGRFSCRRLPAGERGENARDLWITECENALAPVIAASYENDDIPEIIAAAFAENTDLFGSEGASLDEFIAMSREVELRAGDEGTYLAMRGENAPEYDDEQECDCGDEHHHHHGGGGLPEGLGLSGGETDSLAAILKSLGSTLSPTELDAFIFDEYASGGCDVDALYRRLFGTLAFEDDAQEAIFRNMIEERFEDLADRFDRGNDAEIADLRDEILGLIEERLELFEQERDIPETEMKVLSECALFFNELLRHLHRGGYNASADPNGEALLDTFEDYAAKQEAAIRRITGEE
ncbi:MAG: hypothetical protein AB7F40_11120 [Victivallaceae bacterium]|nr:hypothetical protein [Victivallaceae bacterium]